MIMNHYRDEAYLTDERERKWNVIFEENVPNSGKADNLLGEISRAASRIAHRWTNDGDTVDRYYGSDWNVVGGADNYLRMFVRGYEDYSLAGISAENYQYDDAVRKMLNFVLDYLVANEDALKNTPNNEDYQSELYSYKVVYDEEEEYEEEEYDEE